MTKEEISTKRNWNFWSSDNVPRISKAVETAGEQIIAKLNNKTERENAYLLKWIDIFSEQISSQEEEIHKLKLKLYLYLAQSSSSTPRPSPSSSSSFKSMDEHFNTIKSVIF